MLYSAHAGFDGQDAVLRFSALTGLKLWQLDDPQLYLVRVRCETGHGSDCVSGRFGFRTARFTPGGFVFNGQPLKIRGLNRHQVLN